MKKLFILFLIIFIICCQNEPIIKEKESIDNVNISLSIEDESNDIEIYHIYLRHITDKSKSNAINCFDLSNDTSLSLFPGIYNFYLYGLIAKTEKSKQVFSYGILNNIECFNNKNFSIKFKKLYPDVEIQNIESENKVFLKINMNELSGIFSLSSVSIKQGSDRVRSLKFNKENNYYVAEVPLYENGEWFMNISYLLLSSKKDDKILDKDNIYISTSYFKNIYLGDFNFL